MFEPTSRYYNAEVVTGTTPRGHEVAYIRRRFLPDSTSMVVLAEHRVVQGDRLDNITGRYLSDPEQFWRLCDANNAMHPEELTTEIGRKLRVALPQPERI
jgi:hypothetical protein